MEFADNLVKLRKNLDLSQKELSDKTGISVPTLSQYENGNRQPNFDRLKRLKDFFGVSYNELLSPKSKDKVDLRVVLNEEELYFGDEKIDKSAVKALLMFLRHYRK